jgi:hypothetical protein
MTAGLQKIACAHEPPGADVRLLGIWACARLSHAAPWPKTV